MDIPQLLSSTSPPNSAPRLGLSGLSGLGLRSGSAPVPGGSMTWRFLLGDAPKRLVPLALAELDRRADSNGAGWAGKKRQRGGASGGDMW